MKKIILEFDDLHWKYPENCLPTIEKYVNLYPNIKLSFFTVANHSNLPLYQNGEWCDAIRKYINSNNICLAVHGLNHDFLEFHGKSPEETKNSILQAEEIFNKSNLPFVKVFRGPNWGINNNTTQVLEDLGYTHHYIHPEYDKQMYESKPRKIKGIYYNWNLKDESSNEEVQVTHGHTWNVCSNGISETFDKVCNFINNNEVEFKFVHEI